MRRKIVLAITIIVCFLLQTTLFQSLSVASISPNLLIVVTAARLGLCEAEKKECLLVFSVACSWICFLDMCWDFMRFYIC